MKILITCFVIITALTSLVLVDRWTEFEKVWGNYVRQPTHENAVKVYEHLPYNVLNENLPDVNLMDKVYEDWTHISKKVVEEDHDVIRIGFKLFTVADGVFKEDLEIDLGKLIPVNSKLFLTELKKHRHLFEKIDGIVCSYDLEYVDRTDLKMEETDRRMRLLVNVNDPALEGVKAECLKALMDKQEVDKRSIVKVK